MLKVFNQGEEPKAPEEEAPEEETPEGPEKKEEEV